MKVRHRDFPRLGALYHVCRNCGKAQRRPQLKTAGRGKRSAERDSFRKALAFAKGRIKFKILVWGPAPGSANPAEAKREQIKDELRKMGHNAFFSEDLTEPAVPTNIAELVQVTRVVDLVVNVAASHGSLAEFENYGIILGRRNLVFLNKQAQGGFTDTGTRRAFRAAGGDDEFFDDDDLRSCVLTLAAADWVEDKAYSEMQLAMLREVADKESLIR